jgi:hypothetical protein
MLLGFGLSEDTAVRESDQDVVYNIRGTLSDDANEENVTTYGGGLSLNLLRAPVCLEDGR